MNIEAYILGYMTKVAEDTPVKSVSFPEVAKPPVPLSSKDIRNAQKALSVAVKLLAENKADVPGSASASDLPRIRIASDKLSPGALEDLGFNKSLIAVPERGQKQWTTYRHPDRYHIHKHDDAWYMHQDKYLPMQNVLKKIKNKELRVQLDLIFSGIAHGVYEGIPGYIDYLKGLMSKSPNFKEIAEMGPKKYELTKTLKDIL